MTPSGDMGVNEIIRMLGMKPHPEGGHYVETWRDAPGPDGRARFTAIYFLLAAVYCCHLHEHNKNSSLYATQTDAHADFR